MHKCSSCGTDYEGDFCPLCGKKYIDEKVKVLSKIKFAKKVYPFLYYLPAIFLLFFSILLFALSMLPIAISPSIEIMGEKIQSESYGNVYQFAFNSSTEFTNTSSLFIAFIVLSFITLIYSIIAADIRAVTTCNNKKVGRIKLVNY